MMFDAGCVPLIVMPAKAGIHAFLFARTEQGVDGRVKRDHDGMGATMANAVFASEAKQSSLFPAREKKTGLLRRCAPRNDGVGALVAHIVMPAKAGIHDFFLGHAVKVVDGGLRRHDGLRTVCDYA